MRRRVIVFLLVGVVLAGGAWFGYQWYRQGTATAPPLQTAAITVGTISTSVSASGTIAAPQSTTLSWETTGVIQSINVSVGDVVAAGDVLADLEHASLSA